MKKQKNKVVSNLTYCFLIILIMSFYSSVNAQDSSIAGSSTEGRMNNVIKYNLSASLLYDNSLHFSYERVMKKKNQSISIFGGPAQFPVDLSIVNVNEGSNRSKSGYVIGADYRFYLSKENKYAAPHGIYVAPFVASYQFSNSKDVEYTDSAGEKNNLGLDTKVTFFNIGAQLGYQFVIKKHFVIDFVMFGPALTSYRFKANINGDISTVDKESLAAQVIDALKEKYPLLNDLAKGEDVSKDGVEAFWSVGFRYNISIGYRF